MKQGKFTIYRQYIRSHLPRKGKIIYNNKFSLALQMFFSYYVVVTETPIVPSLILVSTDMF